jgi:hypothetical protein
MGDGELIKTSKQSVDEIGKPAPFPCKKSLEVFLPKN